MILAGDIGATKTILALFTRESGPAKALAEAVFPSKDYSSLEDMAAEFLSHASPESPAAACFGVAGPVIQGQSEITNIPWNVSEARLVSTLDIPRVSLINDVQAVGCSIGSLAAADLNTINVGRPANGGAMAVIAPGTGLGEAILLWDGQGYRCYPTEGSHSDFAPADEQQVELLRHAGRRFGHVSWERVCSGIGISNLYAYLLATGDHDEPGWLTEELAGKSDPVPGILRGALETDPPVEICRATVKLFVSILGAEAGNLALKALATGGIYIGGGIAPRVLDIIADGTFMEAFIDKGRLAGLLMDVPVHVIQNPRAALIGAAAVGLGMKE